VQIAGILVVFDEFTMGTSLTHCRKLIVLERLIQAFSCKASVEERTGGASGTPRRVWHLSRGSDDPRLHSFAPSGLLSNLRVVKLWR
jgi:hypothetical protein